MPDYSSLTIAVIKEAIGIASTFIPKPKYEDKPLLTESEAAAVNTDRIKLVRVLLEEVKQDVKCSSCKAHVDSSLEEIGWLEKEVPRIERVTALRENLKNLLEESQKEMNANTDLNLGITEPLEPLLEEKQTKKTIVPAIVPQVIKPMEVTKTETSKVKSACVPCAIRHFTTSAKLLAEAVRFKADGLVSPQVMDDIAESIAEQNALERIDLTPAKIQKLPEWEKEMASTALSKSRELRHKLETVKDMDQLEAIAAETEDFYKVLNREWLIKRIEKPEKKPEVKVLNPETTTNS